MLHHELCNLIETDPRRVIVVVGAGVTLGALHGTKHARHASWGGLIRHGLAHAEDLGQLSPARRARIEAWLDDEDPAMWISVADQLTKALGGPKGGDFARWLRESVGKFEEHVRDGAVLDVLARLERMGVTLATVNYDGLLERATGLPAVTWRKRSEVQRVLLGEARGILHLHGHWQDPESIVLGTTSYDDVAGDPQARTVLASLHLQRTLVFVGHGAGLDDPNWGSFFEWAADVFSSNEHRHYRIARQDELDQLRRPGLQASRIALVGYPGGYDQLGPFLQSLVPPAASEPATPETAVAPATAPPVPALRYVLLLVNIGERHYSFVSREEVESHAGVERIDEVIELPKRVLDLELATAREWREIAASLDEIVERVAAAAREAQGKVCFVVAGVAPSPVFVYLGIQSRRLVGKVLLVNRNTTGGWDRIGPFGGREEFPSGDEQRTAFTRKPPTLLRDPAGPVELFIACSSGYKYSPKHFHAMTVGRGQPVNGVDRIIARLDKGAQPLGAQDLATLTKLAEDTVARRPTSGRLVLAFYGPMWAAFWLGRTLSATVSGHLEIPNFNPGAGYVPALASPMWRQPWISGLPRMLVLTAEPADESRTRATAQVTAIERGLKGVLEPLARVRLRIAHSIRADQLIDLFEEECPDILHIHAHGGKGGAVFLENERGDAHAIGPDRLLAALRVSEARPALVVAVACFSEGLAAGLRELCDCVVVVHETVGYDHSAVFCGALYRALARGCSVAKAFEQGAEQAHVVLGATTRPFELATRDGIDADHVFVWPR